MSSTVYKGTGCKVCGSNIRHRITDDCAVCHPIVRVASKESRRLQEQRRRIEEHQARNWSQNWDEV